MIDKDTFTRNIDFHGAKGLIFIGENILVFRRDTKTPIFPLLLDLPGGGREGDETPFETFSRESMEEFGVTVTEKDILYSRQYPGVLDPTKQSFFFVARPEGLRVEDVVFGDEGLEYFLMTPNEFVCRDDAVSRQKDRVANYLTLLDNNSIII